jgi:hypothetical protein
MEISTKELECGLISGKGKGLSVKLWDFHGFWNCFRVDNAVDLAHGLVDHRERWSMVDQGQGHGGTLPKLGQLGDLAHRCSP